MNILYGKCFGIGNCIMAIPAIKALKSMGHKVDVLIGATSDDPGSREIFGYLQNNKIIENISVNSVQINKKYDIAIMAIPFDGRWQNGVHFNAERVIDGRTRPDPSTFGLSSWDHHEIEYQMDNCYILGYKGVVPTTEFFIEKYDPISLDIGNSKSIKNIYLGIGFKKDNNNFWSVKNWGVENFAQLIRQACLKDENLQFYTTGDILDIKVMINPIKSRLKEWGMEDKLINYPVSNLTQTFNFIKSNCLMYIGHDTGIMHFAASCGMSVIAIFNLENSIVKNHPWCNNYKVLEGWKNTVSVDQVMDAFKELRERKSTQSNTING